MAYFRKSNEDMAFVPKILQQKNHTGSIDKIELLPRYKNELFLDIRINRPNIPRSISIKAGLAIYALDKTEDFPAKNQILETIFYDNSDVGKAIREFIVEFENIVDYVFRKSGNSQVNRALQQLRTGVYQELHSFPIADATPEQKKEFYQELVHSLKNIKKEIPLKKYSELKKLMNLFMVDNIIFHPDLTTYIDETEVFENKPGFLRTANTFMVKLGNVTSASQLAEMLYHMSKRAREHAYKKLPEDLSAIITDADQLADVLLFLPPEHIAALLKKSSMVALISTLDDLTSILNKLFSSDQRAVVFNAFKNIIKDIEPTFCQLGDLMQHLSVTEGKKLIMILPFNCIKFTAISEIISFLEKLTTEKFNKFLPLMAHDIEDYLTRQPAMDEVRALKYFLKEKIVFDRKGLAVYDRIFPEMKSAVKVLVSIKSRGTHSDIRDDKEPPSAFVNLPVD